ncbi:uncharacterized protein L3040_003253 [Drepanopeziza brunnea f. sp. 'multigermtubi']|uniref:RNA polymerase-associated protein LEO1 n=1 Tax=Marssonina brunnea f. sp. multigermtubi (strain MB_m1) TaxID=1072389 RepID=K1WEK3_MARBU|nr:uncharacterized protein MBM_05901 [Drepanopeziza brunnea f. sp. 'multigermtubi' MB_m1]EKD15890.1 hypothetical protein MBM_05901 [Drepanopeziza brunnea f. sp. 'multigermtubi' MB_m1]KAJ5047426.1 hypothetical protein L3040_003253 [Drepanopeziza brunnea f. sp. 'multigermtubi']
MSSVSEDDIVDAVVESDGDLFGDDDDMPAEKIRELSDRELDSGDDEDRRDRAPRAEGVDPGNSKEVQVLEQLLPRHPVPKPADGEYNALRLPAFLGIEPHKFDSNTFQPPTSDHHSTVRSAKFSASAVSSSTMRYRVGSNGKLESNTVVYKWSDGSTTLSIGDQHYELQTASLAPSKEGKNYESVKDSHQYLASPSLHSQLMVVVGHMTNQYTVRPNKDIQDDAVENLQKNLAAAARGGKRDDKNGPELITNTEDPELQKRKAEVAEKERLRAQRRRETAAERANHPRGQTRGGLSTEDLEGRSGRRAPGPGRKAPKPRRRTTEYDSDDDLPRGGRNREDEYDKEDDFLASSDEEMEEGGEDDEEEEILDEDSDRDRHRSKKQKLSKSRPEETSDADADAEADLDDDEAPAPPVITEPTNRGRKRNIIEDDDDE